jgi:ferrous iron transport protein A
VTLNQLSPGQRASLEELPQGLIRSQAVRLGLMPGTEITCVQKLPKGPVIIRKNYQQIAVGAALADQITVKEIDEGVPKRGKRPSRWA